MLPFTFWNGGLSGMRFAFFSEWWFTVIVLACFGLMKRVGFYGWLIMFLAVYPARPGTWNTFMGAVGFTVLGALWTNIVLLPC